MIKHFDHVTIVVRDLADAKRFFGLLGFREDKAVVITGASFSDYMNVPLIEADHVTLVAEVVSPRTEIQLLRYRHPTPIQDPHVRELNKLGFNHICFAVDNLDQTVSSMIANGYRTKNKMMDFHSRKLVFLEGPEGITVELSEWH